LQHCGRLLAARLYGNWPFWRFYFHPSTSSSVLASLSLPLGVSRSVSAAILTPDRARHTAASPPEWVVQISPLAGKAAPWLVVDLRGAAEKAPTSATLTSATQPSECEKRIDIRRMWNALNWLPKLAYSARVAFVVAHRAWPAATPPPHAQLAPLATPNKGHKQNCPQAKDNANWSVRTSILL